MAEHETEDPIIGHLKQMNRHLLWIECGVIILVLAAVVAVGAMFAS